MPLSVVQPDSTVTDGAATSIELDAWYLRPKEVSRLTGIPASTVREAIYRGDLPARKFRARGWLITAEDVHRWIDQQTVPSTEALSHIA